MAKHPDNPGSKGILGRAIREVMRNKPRTVKKGQSKSGERKQLLAIAFSKSRRNRNKNS